MKTKNKKLAINKILKNIFFSRDQSINFQPETISLETYFLIPFLKGSLNYLCTIAMVAIASEMIGAKIVI